MKIKDPETSKPMEIAYSQVLQKDIKQSLHVSNRLKFIQIILSVLMIALVIILILTNKVGEWLSMVVCK